VRRTLEPRRTDARYRDCTRARELEPNQVAQERRLAAAATTQDDEYLSARDVEACAGQEHLIGPADLQQPARPQQPAEKIQDRHDFGEDPDGRPPQLFDRVLCAAHATCFGSASAAV
jgi:hypothetical protein